MEELLNSILSFINNTGNKKEKKLFGENFSIDKGIFRSFEEVITLSSISIITSGHAPKKSYLICVLAIIAGIIAFSGAGRSQKPLVVLWIVCFVIGLVLVVLANQRRDYKLFICLHNGINYTISHKNPEFLVNFRETIMNCINENIESE